jgi:DhnA family fructose-bisphosphate aldolase class Ia
MLGAGHIRSLGHFFLRGEIRMSVIPRLNRLFAADGKCFEVALDHGAHNEPSYLPGMENLKDLVSTVAEANPDAILLSLGQAHWLQEMAGKAKPALVVRVDPTNLYNVPTPRQVFCYLMDKAVERAVALDAASLVVNLLWASDQPDLYRQCLGNVCRAKAQCERYGLPLMVEPLVMLPERRRGGYKMDPELSRTVSLVRQAVELGADVVKADPCSNLNEYHLVVEAASPKPVLPRGGAQVSDKEILTRTFTLINQGVSGIVYGRNIFQHSYPQRMVRACKAIVHEDANVAQALAILKEGSGGE